MKTWKLSQRPKQNAGGFVDRTADDEESTLYAYADVAEMAWKKFEDLCGPLKRNEYTVSEVPADQVDEDWSVL